MTPRSHSAARLAPVLLVAAGVAILPVMDAIAKGLTGIATVGAIAVVRYLVQAVVSAPAAWRATAGRPWRVAGQRLLVLRGLLSAAGGLLFFAGAQRLALADNLAIAFVYPLVVALLAPAALGERLAPRGLLAVAVGFAGVCVIIRPGSGVMGPAALLPLGFAGCYAGYLLVTRALARRVGASPTVLQFWTAVHSTAWALAAVALAAPLHLAPLGLHVARPWAWGAMLAMGVVGTVGHWLLTAGARHLAAGVHAGLGYGEIVSTALLGWLLWGDVPDAPTWLGLAIVVGSGLWLVRAEHGAPAAPAPVPAAAGD